MAKFEWVDPCAPLPAAAAVEAVAGAKPRWQRAHIQIVNGSSKPVDVKIELRALSFDRDRGLATMDPGHAAITIDTDLPLTDEAVAFWEELAGQPVSRTATIRVPPEVFTRLVRELPGDLSIEREPGIELEPLGAWAAQEAPDPIDPHCRIYPVMPPGGLPAAAPADPATRAMATLIPGLIPEPTTTEREDAVGWVLERLDEFQRAVMFERLAQDGMTRDKAAHVRRREWDREQAAKGKPRP